MNQSCVVSGESGSGKTISCGFLIKYLAVLSKDAVGLGVGVSTGSVEFSLM